MLFQKKCVNALHRSEASNGLAASFFLSNAPSGWGPWIYLLFARAWLMFLFACVQDDRGQLERFTNTVKVLMVVVSMQENDATAEVPGVGLTRLFSCTANALPGFLAFKMRWRRPRKIQMLCSDVPKTACHLEAVRWTQTASQEEAQYAVVRDVLFVWTPTAGREAAR